MTTAQRLAFRGASRVWVQYLVGSPSLLVGRTQPLEDRFARALRLTSCPPAVSSLFGSNQGLPLPPRTFLVTVQ